jgi:hypothetical protein
MFAFFTLFRLSWFIKLPFVELEEQTCIFGTFKNTVSQLRANPCLFLECSLDSGFRESDGLDIMHETMNNEILCRNPLGAAMTVKFFFDHFVDSIEELIVLQLSRDCW